MSAVSAGLRELIKEIQSLNSLSDFALAGGTSLALRFNHRRSIDIDLFCHGIIGRDGFNQINAEILSHFGERVKYFEYPCNENDQFIFARCLIQWKKETVKIEIIQNMIFTKAIENIDEIRIVSADDLGIYKLIATYYRDAKKDIYDLEYLTNHKNLIYFYDLLCNKLSDFSEERHKSIFMIEKPVDVTALPSKLLQYRNYKTEFGRTPSHSNDTIDYIEGKKWTVSHFFWMQKVRELFKQQNIEFPTP